MNLLCESEDGKHSGKKSSFNFKSNIDVIMGEIDLRPKQKQVVLDDFPIPLPSSRYSVSDAEITEDPRRKKSP